MRLLRGLEIVAKGGQIVRKSGSVYLVRSQSGNGWYEVFRRREVWACQCEDYRKRGKECKHIFAVAFLLRLPEVLRANQVDFPPLASTPVQEAI